GRASRAPNDLHHFAWRGREVAAIDVAARAIDGDPIALVNDDVAHDEQTLLEIDVHLPAADDGALAHAARDDGGVARHPAARREHRARGDDAVEVFWRGLVADEDNRLVVHRPRLGHV